MHALEARGVSGIGAEQERERSGLWIKTRSDYISHARSAHASAHML